MSATNLNSAPELEALEQDEPKKGPRTNDFDRFCDEIRDRIDTSARHRETEAGEELAEEVTDPDMALFDFPENQLAKSFPEDVTLSGQNNFHGMAALHHSNQELKALLESLTSAVSSPENTKPARNSRIDMMEQELAERDAQIAKMKIEATMLQSGHDKREALLKEQIAERDSEIETLEQKLAASIQTVAESDSRCEKLENQLVGINQEKLRLKAFAEQVEGKYHSLRTEAAKVTYDKANGARLIEKRDAEIRSLREAVELINSQLARSSQGFEHQSDVIAKLQAHVSTQQDRLAMMVQHQEKLQSDIQTHREINANTKNMLSMTRKMNISKLEIREKEIERLKAENAELQRQLGGTDNALPHLRLAAG